MTSHKLTNIQILRGVAAIWVVLYHALGLPLPGGVVNQVLAFIAASGYFGVDIFFVLSGFVIYYSVHGKDIGARAFFRRRAERIFPPYFVLTTALFLAILALPNLFHTLNASLDHFLRSVFYLSFTRYDFPVLYIGWTLEYEMLFYALTSAMLVFGVVAFERLPVVISALVGVGVAIAMLDGAPAPVRFLTNPIILEFAFGFVIGAVFLAKKTDRYNIAALVAAICGVVLVNPTHRALLAGIPSAILLCICLGMSHMVTLPQAVRSPLSILGDASYSIYLIQVFTLPIAQKFSGFMPALLGRNFFILLATGFTILLGWLFFKCVESPVVTAFKKRRQRGVARPAAYANAEHARVIKPLD